MKNRSLSIASALLSGGIFGVGLIISGMVNPAKVLAFLDIVGNWDPSLIFVMMGAIGIAIFAYGIAKQRKTSLFGQAIAFTSNRHIDQRLIIGSIVFGTGWGISGICPGPAVLMLTSGQAKGVYYFVAMMAGMGLYEFIEHQWPGKNISTELQD